MTRSRDDDRDAGWPPTFWGGYWPVVAFVAAFSLWVLASNGLADLVLGPEPPRHVEDLWNVPSGVVQVGIAVAVLRYEGVRFRDLGLDRRRLGSAVVAVAAFLVALNAVVGGLLVLDGVSVSVEPYAVYRSPPLNYSPTAIAVAGLTQYAFVGPVEELAFRGYLQNKLTSILGPGSARVRTALGIVAAAVVFALVHVPTLLVFGGGGTGRLPGALALLTLSGITFGAMYALTRNLYLVALLHGIGNFWPLVVDPGIGAWPNWGVILVLYALLVVAYRRWAVVPPSPVAPTGAEAG